MRRHGKKKTISLYQFKHVVFPVQIWKKMKSELRFVLATTFFSLIKLIFSTKTCNGLFRVYIFRQSAGKTLGKTHMDFVISAFREEIGLQDRHQIKLSFDQIDPK